MGKYTDTFTLEGYVGFGIDYLSDEAIYEHINEIMENMKNGCALDAIRDMIALMVLHEELDNRFREDYINDEYAISDFDSVDIFIKEMERKSKFITKRENKKRDFKKNEKIHKNSIFKAGFKFNQKEANKIKEEKRNGNYDYCNEHLNYTKEKGRYIRYYESKTRKFLKKQSNKRIRKDVYGVPLRGSKYKRYLDMDWILN